ncbi:MAG: hypothetical protein LBO72_03235 [Helicobacteraceae bacterium]|jgi:hypothetical protein|nr:hypothetical protein [Helicobacteraceae bacterium]
MRLKKFATQLTIGFGFVVFVSGLLMFFGVKTRPIHGVHEYIGLLFTAIIALHLIDHKRAAIGYFKKWRDLALIAASIALSAAFFAVASEKGGENAMKTIAEKTLDAPLAVSARLFDLSAESAVQRLSNGGISVLNAQESLRSIAEKNNLRPDLIIEKLSL